MTKKQFFVWLACCLYWSNGSLIAQQMPSVEVDNLVSKIEAEINALELYKNRLTSLGLLRGNIKEFRSRYLNEDRLETGKLDDLDNILAILEGESGKLLRQLKKEEDIDTALKGLMVLKADIKTQEPLYSLLTYEQAYKNASLFPKPEVEKRKLRKAMKRSEKNLFKNLYHYVKNERGEGTVLTDDLEAYSAGAKDKMAQKLDKFNNFTNQLLHVFSDVENSNNEGTSIDAQNLPLLELYGELYKKIAKFEKEFSIHIEKINSLRVEEKDLKQDVNLLLGQYDSQKARNAELTVISDSIGKYNDSLIDSNILLVLENEGLLGNIIDSNKLLVALKDGRTSMTLSSEYCLNQPSVAISLGQSFCLDQPFDYPILEELKTLEDRYMLEKLDILKKLEKAKKKAIMLGVLLSISLILLLYLRIVKLRSKNILLREKNELLQNTFNELNHRVKNNLRMIAAMVSLQARDTGNKAVKIALKEARGRLQAVAFLHGELYKNQSLTHVDIAAYTTNLIEYLKKAFELENSPVELKMSIQNIEMESDHAIPIGVLVNEVVTNAFKHAFKGEDRPELTINLHKSSLDEVVLYIKDNGVGIPSRVNIGNPKSFGMKVIKMLVKKQLKGTFSFRNEGGTIFQSCLKFK